MSQNRMPFYDTTPERRAYCLSRETRCRPYDITLRRRACCARRKNGSGPYDTLILLQFLARNLMPRHNATVHVAKPDGVYTSPPPFVVRTVHVAKLDGVHTTLRFVQCTFRNPMAFVRPGVVRTVQVAKSNSVHTTLRLWSSVLCTSLNRMPSTRHYATAPCGRETRLRQYDMPLKRRAYSERREPDGVHSTLHSGVVHCAGRET